MVNFVWISAVGIITVIACTTGILQWSHRAGLRSSNNDQPRQSTTDLPCSPLQLDDSVVCVCNSTYCDTFTRDPPVEGHYTMYTSNRAGLRFQKSTGRVDPFTRTNKIIDQILASFVLNAAFEVQTNIEYQEVQGFGGSVTDAAGINWKSLSESAQQLLIDSYFSSTGLEYNMVRVPIGGSDFSTHPYAYNMWPEDDPGLSNYTLAYEDYEYKLPMFRSLLAAATDEVKIVATAWSPPTWMKTNDMFFGFSRLKEEYYQTYADYYLKFLEEYYKEGVNIWAITTTNEPINGVVPFVRFNSLGWIPSEQSQWVVDHLGPTMRNSSFNVKILAVDDQRYLLPGWIATMAQANPAVLGYLDGLAVHYYGNFFPGALLDWVHTRFPDQFILATEACEGAMPWNRRGVVLGSWGRAESYITNIMDDLKHWVVGWIDWNMCLSPGGGPNWADNYVDSPIITFPETDRFYKNPMFYALGHFSKFIPRGSRRVFARSLKLTDSLDYVAFKTPRSTLVIVAYNSGALRRNVDVIVDSGRRIAFQIQSKEIKTIELDL